MIIPVTLKKGVLTQFGYHSDNTVRSRHIALMRAVREEGYLPIIRRLNLIATFSRYRSPRYTRIFKTDQQWLSKRYAIAKEGGMREEPRRGLSAGLTAPVASPRSASRASSASASDDEEDEWSDEE